MSLLLLILTPIAKAEDSSPSPARNAVLTQKAEKEAVKNTRLQISDDKKASREAQLDEKKANIVTQANSFLERTNKIISRLDNIWAKTQTRITKLKDKGVDLTSLDEKIPEVAVKKETAQNAVLKAQNLLTDFESTSSPKSLVQEFRTSYTNVKTAVKDYHQTIVVVIRDLQNLTSTKKATMTPEVKL
ncbi:hypothetical protein A3D03_02125 [Candidatus Gottesmanbacteria bacterium RIFCSPHIGHO2_02_FULL_40_13]|uniref:Uncharacterized protein n=1 Tax=Candidatus Gottesmanbacteria bacterium RIFCSPHIGHO2_02_FULL_40_13 TaxID=1798384 RepID=A0A1F6AC05_9BACT|nr:MAG: hypothetical protein A3D03_02125 [Candidatus Gottesmanbacteria bacterium RIFCSPHIGHO2_02_FULL_40_13]